MWILIFMIDGSYSVCSSRSITYIIIVRTLKFLLNITLIFHISTRTLNSRLFHPSITHKYVQKNRPIYYIGIGRFWYDVVGYKKGVNVSVQ